jgi:hypothetical protein
MKEIAQHRLEWDFEGEIKSAYRDDTFIGTKMPDAGIEFTEPKYPYVKGILVEVQYRNEGKDIEETTKNYLQNGYAVCWLTEDDFDGKSVDILGNSEMITPWEELIPDSEEWGSDSESEFELDLWKIREFQSIPYGVILQIRNRRDIPPADTYYTIQDLASPFVTDIESYEKFIETVESMSRNRILSRIVREVWNVAAHKIPNTHSHETRVQFPPEYYEVQIRQLWDETPWESKFHDSETYQFESNIANVVEGEPYPISTTIPGEFIDDHKEDLKRSWSRGKETSQFDVKRKLSESNADRKCDECGDSADYYLARWGDFSGFRCKTHQPADHDSEP